MPSTTAMGHLGFFDRSRGDIDFGRHWCRLDELALFETERLFRCVLSGHEPRRYAGRDAGLRRRALPRRWSHRGIAGRQRRPRGPTGPEPAFQPISGLVDNAPYPQAAQQSGGDQRRPRRRAVRAQVPRPPVERRRIARFHGKPPPQRSLRHGKSCTDSCASVCRAANGAIRHAGLVRTRGRNADQRSAERREFRPSPTRSHGYDHGRGCASQRPRCCCCCCWGCCSSVRPSAAPRRTSARRSTAELRRPRGKSSQFAGTRGAGYRAARARQRMGRPRRAGRRR